MFFQNYTALNTLSAGNNLILNLKCKKVKPYAKYLIKCLLKLKKIIDLIKMTFGAFNDRIL